MRSKPKSFASATAQASRPARVHRQNLRGGIDNCGAIPLSDADIERVIDAVSRDQLPHTEGFFFGATDGTEKEETLMILTAALAWLRTADASHYRTVYYRRVGEEAPCCGRQPARKGATDETYTVLYAEDVPHYAHGEVKARGPKTPSPGPQLDTDTSRPTNRIGTARSAAASSPSKTPMATSSPRLSRSMISSCTMPTPGSVSNSTPPGNVRRPVRSGDG